MLFWHAPANVRMTRLAPGERRAGRSVIPRAGFAVDAVWTGQHFLVVTDGAFDRQPGLAGQLVTADGDRIGGVLSLAGAGVLPRLAASRSLIVLLYSEQPERGGLWAATINSAGTVLSRKQLLTEGPPLRGYDIASNGSGFAIVVSTTGDDQLLTLNANGELRTTQMLGTSNGSARIASDGRGYLVATAVNDRTLVSRVDANGTISAPVTLSEPGLPTSVVWTGSGYAVAVRDDETTRIVHLDAAGLSTTAVEPVALATGPNTAPQLAAAGGKITAAWIDQNFNGYVAELPLASPTGREALFGAAEQQLLATASADSATLFVWSEVADIEYSLRIGVRASDGTWTEQLLERILAGNTLAASNGREFLVVRGASRSTAVVHRILTNGQSAGPPVTVDIGFVPEAMIWNGERYVFIGGDFNLTSFQILDVLVASMSEDLVVSPPVTIRQSGEYVNRRIAWNGREHLAIWQIPGPNDRYSTAGVRLGADLRRIGSDFAFGTGDGAFAPHVVADGSDFLVFRQAAELIATRVSGGRVTDEITIPESQHAGYSDSAAVAGGIAVTWQNRDTNTHHVAMLRQGTGAVASQHEVLTTYGENIPRIVALPNAKAAFATAASTDAAPHHGAARVIAAVLDFAPPAQLTAAPQLTVRLQGTRLRIEWTALAQPVTGYRVEYRIGDGNWNELDRSPDPTSRVATFLPPRPNTTYSFRVRGMSDGGMGPYSSPVSLYLGKRRSVR
jgi:hypothetical protein